MLREILIGLILYFISFALCRWAIRGVVWLLGIGDGE